MHTCTFFMLYLCIPAHFSCYIYAYLHIFLVIFMHTCTFFMLYLCIPAHFSCYIYAYLHIFHVIFMHTCTYFMLYLCILAHFSCYIYAYLHMLYLCITVHVLCFINLPAHTDNILTSRPAPSLRYSYHIIIMSHSTAHSSFISVFRIDRNSKFILLRNRQKYLFKVYLKFKMYGNLVRSAN